MSEENYISSQCQAHLVFESKEKPFTDEDLRKLAKNHPSKRIVVCPDPNEE